MRTESYRSLYGQALTKVFACLIIYILAAPPNAPAETQAVAKSQKLVVCVSAKFGDGIRTETLLISQRGNETRWSAILGDGRLRQELSGAIQFGEGEFRHYLESLRTDLEARSDLGGRLHSDDIVFVFSAIDGDNMAWTLPLRLSNLGDGLESSKKIHGLLHSIHQAKSNGIGFMNHFLLSDSPTGAQATGYAPERRERKGKTLRSKN
ncbi:hypothetical protein Enr13x_54820 [Stieleria neptunia]|uniref:Uncharacterized protein n=1 Tax=Stieleria neptunia TaxID=2527979 RepID=A0A518HXL8_9BACT|nr:hypothetical protein Enr13x_43110 [Stieleria neptunia]QDV45603.1 hypothetical protein Enr13x_54820 [Stieleria neptunia]